MVLRWVGFTIVMETMAVVVAPQDLHCLMMMMLPLVMPFIWGILFSMCLSVDRSERKSFLLFGCDLLVAFWWDISRTCEIL
jgi:Sec-independent protein secretion pathway component TatC